CKHAVATVLRHNFETAVRAHQQGGTAAPSSPAGAAAPEGAAPRAGTAPGRRGGVPDWKDALTEILGGPDAAEPPAEEPEGVALECDLRREPYRYVHGTGRAGSPWHLYVRPVRRGRRGGWIKGGLDWESVTADAGRWSLSPAQVDWFDELR